MLLKARSFTLIALAPLLPLACQEAKSPTQPGGPQTQPASSADTAPSGSGPAVAAADGASAASGVDMAAIDTSARACDDFYGYACGGWKKNTPIPEDEAAWYRSFNGIQERNEATLRGLLEAFAKGENHNEPYAKALGDLYAACMDEQAIETAGVAPLAPDMTVVASAKDPRSLSVAVARLHRTGVTVPWTVGTGSDFKDAGMMIGQIEQHGLGLPDRDFYLSEDAKKKQIYARYLEGVERMHVLAGDTPAAAKAAAKTVARMETALAKASMSREDRRDPKKVYHRVDRKELAALAPHVAWEAYFAELGAPDVKTLNVAQADYLKAVDGLVVSAPPADWRTYLRWHVLRERAERLPARFDEEAFKLRQALTGVAKQPPRWKRCVRAVDNRMGEALGQAFVKATLGAEGKASVQKMIRGIEAAMGENLKRLPWMDEPTRKRADEKLTAIANMIAYPEKWKTYEGLEVKRGDHMGNTARSQAYELAREMRKAGKPVDKTEWGMSPPTVNAYYDPSMNQMVFPAGILQPPYYANGRSMAANYGGIGMVMGHELTHGFDDEGRQFDAVGNLTDWWTPTVNAEFDRRAACVEKQYAAFQVPGGDHVNGKLTLGENIADLGGIKLAHAAFVSGDAPKSSAGPFTPAQQFFLGFAQGWCANERDEFLRTMVTVNPHSPARFRVNGPLANLPTFAQAFSCKAGDKMVRPEAERCEIW